MFTTKNSLRCVLTTENYSTEFRINNTQGYMSSFSLRNYSTSPLISSDMALSKVSSVNFFKNQRLILLLKNKCQGG
jgi:hypothetical protein